MRDVGDLLVGRARLGEADVVGDRSREQERVLQHDAELPAVRAQLDAAQVVAVDEHRAVVRVVEAPDELRGRRLAAAGFADEGEAAPGRHVDVDRVQDRLAPVRECDAVELQVAVDPRQLRVGCVADLRLDVEDPPDLLHRRTRRLHLAVQVGELLQRLEDEVQQEDRRRRVSRS